MPSHDCPKCQSRMTRGFLVDQTYGGRAVPTWAEGEPRKSIWVGVVVDKKAAIEVETWRCARCGFLESYAPAH